MRALPVLLLALALAACAAPAIDRADHAAERRIEQAAAEARQTAQDAIRRADELRAAAVADVAQRVDAARAAALADVDARLTAQREAARADVTAIVAPVLDELRATREAAQAADAAWRERIDRALDESEAWRGEVAGIRAQVAAALGPVAPSPTPAPGPTPLDPTDRYALWAALAGAAFTVAKTGVRLWRARKGGAE